MERAGKGGREGLGDEEEWEKREEKVWGEMRKSRERRKIRFGGDEEEWEKKEDKVWG
ncbi:TPA: hypothetical protein ACX6PH_003539 [Photobacterium damselae]